MFEYIYIYSNIATGIEYSKEKKSVERHLIHNS